MQQFPIPIAWPVIGVCGSLAFSVIGAIVGLIVGALAEDMPHALTIPSCAGAIGSVIGGWLALLAFFVLSPDPRDNVGLGWSAMFVAAIVGSLILSTVAARWGKGRKPPSS